jgi:hypothetical protein
MPAVLSAGARHGTLVAGLAREGSTMGDGDSGYRFGTGIGEDEVARLEIQGSALAPATRMIFAEAGIRPGMRVLDLVKNSSRSTGVPEPKPGYDDDGH